MQEQQGRFGCLLVRREVGPNPGLFFATEGRVGQDHVHPILVADLGDLHGQAVAVGDAGRLQAVQQQIHLGQHVRQRLGLTAEDALLLQRRLVLDRLALLFQVLVRLGQEPARAARRVEDRFAKLRIDRRDHEPDDRPGRVEFAGVPGRVPHFPQHGLVQVAQRVDLVGGIEVDAIDQVDHVPQQVAADHAVDDAAEDRGDHVAATVAVAALQRPAGRRTDPAPVCHRGVRLRRC